MYFSGIASFIFDWHVQFDMNNAIDSTGVARMTFIFILLSIGVRLGNSTYKKSYSLKKNNEYFKNKIANGICFLNIAFLTSFSIYAQFLFIDSINLSRSITGIERIMGGKYLYPTMIYAAIATITNIKRKRFEIYSLALLAYISILFAYGDGTRAALIGIAFVTIYSLITKNRKILLISLPLMLIIFFFMVIGRRLVSGEDYTENDIDFFESVGIYWQYFFSFSALHAGYASHEDIGRFQIIDFLYSIAPIPGALLEPQNDIREWRVDQFRPLGSQAEMWKINPVMNLLFGFMTGYLSKKIDTAENKMLGLFSGLIIILAYAMSFQYGLRTIQWFFWLAIFLLFIPKNKYFLFKK